MSDRRLEQSSRFVSQLLVSNFLAKRNSKIDKKYQTYATKLLNSFPSQKYDFYHQHCWTVSRFQKMLASQTIYL